MTARCEDCRRPLKDPASRARGIRPTDDAYEVAYDHLAEAATPA